MIFPCKTKIIHTLLPLQRIIDYDHRFIDVGTYSSGSVFGLGERIEHRTIVARNVVQCLLIPRYWLFQKPQNKGNIWQRIKLYLDSSIPSREKLYNEFLANLEWMKYRRQLVDDFVGKHPQTNTTRYFDVPVICRIEAGEGK
jgi:hypothetical protein